MSAIGEAVAEALPVVLKLLADRLPSPMDQRLAQDMLADRLKLRASMQVELDERHHVKEKP